MGMASRAKTSKAAIAVQKQIASIGAFVCDGAGAQAFENGILSYAREVVEQDLRFLELIREYICTGLNAFDLVQQSALSGPRIEKLVRFSPPTITPRLTLGFTLTRCRRPRKSFPVSFFPFSKKLRNAFRVSMRSLRLSLYSTLALNAIPPEPVGSSSPGTSEMAPSSSTQEVRVRTSRPNRLPARPVTDGACAAKKLVSQTCRTSTI
jgi:hypothetical protein